MVGMPAPSGKRLLFFAYYFPPLGGAGSQRALSFARHLPAHGWEVVVVTPREGVYGLDSSFPMLALPGVCIVRTGTFEPAVLVRRLLGKGRASGGGTGGSYVDEVEVGTLGHALRQWVRRRLYFPDSSRGWVRSAVAAARKVHRKTPVTAVLSSSPPVSGHLAAMRFSKEQGIPWVADWRDLWVEHLDRAAPRLPESLALDREILGTADGLTAVTASLGQLLRMKKPRGPVRTVRNGFEPEDFSSTPPPAFGEEGFRIVYTGTVYSPEEQYLGAFLEALRQVNEEGGGKRVRLRILGKVHPESMELVRRSDPGGAVDLAGFVSHEETIRSIQQADLLFVMTTTRTDRSGLAEVPAKTYEYLAARRPILVLTEEGSETQRVLKGLVGVWFRGFRDVEGIRSAIREAMAFRPVPLPSWDGLAAYSRGSQAAALAGLLDEVSAARTGATP